MKREENRLEVDALYILGAGASHSLSEVKTSKETLNNKTTPLDTNFLRNLIEDKPGISWRKDSIELLEKGWIEKTSLIKQGLEQAIINRVSQYDFLKSIHRNRLKGKCSNEDYLNNLSHLITYYLKRCKANNSGSTKKFINATFPKGTEIKESKNRIITFNYDTLIERPFIERGISKKKIYFDRIVKDFSEGLKRNSSDVFPEPLILKLHGSMNWRVQREYFDKIINGSIEKDDKVVIWSDDSATLKPTDDISPLIIPPIPNKPITKTSIFRFLWTTAYEYLHHAKRIVIVGYSCPYSDTMARVMFSQFKNKNLEEIFVVDPNVIALRNYRELLDPSITRKVKWKYYSTFTEYIEGEL